MTLFEKRVCPRAWHQTGHFLAGSRTADFCNLLAQAEADPAALEPACRALDDLLRAVAAIDLERPDARIAIVRAAWAEMLPGYRS